MRITGISPFGVSSPFADWTYVRVETDQPGLVGWGECSLPGKTQAVQGALKDLANLVVGADPLESEYCWQRMYRHAFWRGGPIQTAAISGIDMALWDIRGKEADKSVCELLGGPVRRRIRLYANIGLATDPQVFRERTSEAIALGYTAVKLYPLPAVAPSESAATIGQVVACCAAVREVLGDGRDFALDFHGRPTAGLAVQLEAAVRHTHPLWIEEPVVPETPNALQRCAEKFVTPIAAGERLFTRWDFRPLLEQQLVSIIQPDVANAGGITELAKIASLAELYGVTFNPHSPNGPLQCLASLHLAAWAQPFGMLEHRHEGHTHMAKICTCVPAVDADGHIAPPAGPGLGAEMIEQGLRDHPPQAWIAESFRADGSIGDW